MRPANRLGSGDLGDAIARSDRADTAALLVLLLLAGLTTVALWQVVEAHRRHRGERAEFEHMLDVAADELTRRPRFEAGSGGEVIDREQEQPGE